VGQDTRHAAAVFAQATAYYINKLSGRVIMEMFYCSQCGKPFNEDELIRFGEQMVCAGCKPFYIQKLREGVATTGAMVYGGFWIRVGAKIIDAIILYAVNMMLGFAIGFITGRGLGGVILHNLVYIGLGVCYTTYFLGTFGATPGKMACGLKVVRSDDEKISYGRACGRHFAEILSAIILCIGYIMVAFDDEKRALHDRICDTRVIRKA
jgi:uncharacterized RDD family membrane protein YckC/DNA-directed RNA polymerase subunit RPC12/RpoP